MIFKRIRNWLYPDITQEPSVAIPTPTHSKGPGKRAKKGVLPDTKTYRNAKMEFRKIIDDFRKGRAKNTQPSPNIWWCLNNKCSKLCGNNSYANSIKGRQVKKAWEEVVDPIEVEISGIQRNHEKHTSPEQVFCEKKGWSRK